MADSGSPDVFDYVDFRAFLGDYYTYQKRHRRGFSYRAFSKRAKLGSPNHLKRVIDSDSNLTLEMAGRFADAMGLDGDGGAYFVELVRLGQAPTSTERSQAYTRLRRFKAYRLRRKLDMAHADYHATWYMPAVRELAGRQDFVADAEWIASRLIPRITVAEARGALRTLVQLALLREREDGGVEQVEPLVTTGPEMHALHIADYHRMMMVRAAASIDLVPSERRDISAVTLLLSQGGLSEVKAIIQRVRRELLELTVTQVDATQVVQVNFQLFPLSVAPEDEQSS